MGRSHVYRARSGWQPDPFFRSRGLAGHPTAWEPAVSTKGAASVVPDRLTKALRGKLKNSAPIVLAGN